MIIQIPVGGYDNNFSYLIKGKDDGCAVVDPVNPEMIDDFLRRYELHPRTILLTHSHFDHVEGVPEMLSRYPEIKVFIHKNARGRILNVDKNQVNYLADGDELTVDGLKIQILHTPGHIDDAICFYIKEDKALITGDTVFVEACGRADLKHSNVEDLYWSLQKIKKFPPETRIFPGHNYGSRPVSDVAWEMVHNKYLIEDNLEDFAILRG